MQCTSYGNTCPCIHAIRSLVYGYDLQPCNTVLAAANTQLLLALGCARHANVLVPCPRRLWLQLGINHGWHRQGVGVPPGLVLEVLCCPYGFPGCLVLHFAIPHFTCDYLQEE